MAFSPLTIHDLPIALESVILQGGFLVRETIECVRDCDEIFDDFYSEYAKSTNRENTFLYPCQDQRFLLGVWFRGEPETKTPLTPSVFRSVEKKGSPMWIEEHSIFNYARNRIPAFTKYSDKLFETLSLMQHHGIPTRLLDWSESLLVALYFAVRDLRSDQDSLVFVLNARRLNRITSMRNSWDNIHDDTSFGTKFRCEFVLSDCRKDLV